MRREAKQLVIRVLEWCKSGGLIPKAGVYMPDSLNHGKVVYKKQEKSRGC